MEGGYRAWRTHQPRMRRLTGAAQQAGGARSVRSRWVAAAVVRCFREFFSRFVSQPTDRATAAVQVRRRVAAAPGSGRATSQQSSNPSHICARTHARPCSPPSRAHDERRAGAPHGCGAAAAAGGGGVAWHARPTMRVTSFDLAG